MQTDWFTSHQRCDWRRVRPAYGEACTTRPTVGLGALVSTIGRGSSTKASTKRETVSTVTAPPSTTRSTMSCASRRMRDASPFERASASVSFDTTWSRKSLAMRIAIASSRSASSAVSVPSERTVRPSARAERTTSSRPVCSVAAVAGAMTSTTPSWNDFRGNSAGRSSIVSNRFARIRQAPTAVLPEGRS